MPIYEYQCQACGERSEVMQRMNDPLLETCEDCGGALKKLISAPAFQFKGDGWYVTDYARKEKDAKQGGKPGGGGKSETPSESKSETKSESKSETKSEGKTKSESSSGSSGGKTASGD